MKKNLLILAVAGLALASCSNDETVAVNNSATEISFRPYVAGQTRANPTETTTSVFTESNGFFVEAYKSESKYFGPAEFVLSESNYHGKTNKYYWPAEGNLDFYAYYPDPSTTADITGSKNSFTVTPSTTENPTHVDFVFAKTKNQSKTSSTSGIPLAFKHICSWIDVKVYNDNASLKTYVTGWKVGYLRPGGVFTYPADGASTSGTALPAATSAGGGDSYWSYTATTHDASLATEYKATYSNNNSNLISAATADAAVSLGNNMILVPQVLTSTSKTNYDANNKLQCSFIAIKLMIKDAGGTTIADGTQDAKWAIWPIPNTNWDPGMKYTYKINLAQGGYYETGTTASGALEQLLSGAEIFFNATNVTVTPWSDSTPAVTM